jgi:hypothetical protein
MSNQSTLQAAIRAETGTTGPFNGDWCALFDLSGIPQGAFNERLLAWLNASLGDDYTNLPEAWAAYTANQGGGGSGGAVVINPLGYPGIGADAIANDAIGA